MTAQAVQKHVFYLDNFKALTETPVFQNFDGAVELDIFSTLAQEQLRALFLDAVQTQDKETAQTILKASAALDNLVEEHWHRYQEIPALAA